MAGIGELVQQGDWKSEKHSPVIECPCTIKAGEAFEVKASLGKGVAHPNTTEHHISYISLYFKPDNGKFPYQVGRYEFSAHGESAAGPNQGPVYTNPSAVASVTISEPGVLYAVSFCNIHGLWESSKAVTFEACADCCCND